MKTACGEKLACVEAPAMDNHEGGVFRATLGHPGFDERLEERAVVGGHF